jgi:DNA-binding NtrC family response regulator
MILLVDDDVNMRLLFEHWFKGYDYIITHNADEAYAIMRHKQVDMLVTDFALHERLGSDLAKFAADVLCIPVILITAHTEIVSDLRRNFRHIFVKPVEWEELIRVVRQSINERKR